MGRGRWEAPAADAAVARTSLPEALGPGRAGIMELRVGVCLRGCAAVVLGAAVVFPR